MTELALYQLLSLLLLVLLAQWLAERTAARHIGAGLLAIIFGAIAANSRMLPTGTDSQQPVSGALAGTYTGGSLNFSAVAQQLLPAVI